MKESEGTRKNEEEGGRMKETKKEQEETRKKTDWDKIPSFTKKEF